MTSQLEISNIGQHIYTLRGLDVMLDTDLADLYSVSPKRLNEQARRNLGCFPDDFMFQLTNAEFSSVKSDSLSHSRGQHRKYLPLAYTEAGAIMLSSVFKKANATEVKVAITRAFIKKRNSKETPLSFSPDYSQLADRLEQKLDHIVHAIEKLTEVVAQSQKPQTQLAHVRPVAPTRAALPAPQIEQVPNSVQSIIDATAHYFRLTSKDLKRPTRTKSIALPRQIAMYLVRKHTGMGLKEIGAYFGGKDHTTIMHACRKIESTLSTNSKVRDAIPAIEKAAHCPAI